jgi:3-deoxy-D-manno-octulosonate 8-phosphate phosphatase (KDO 8-P phosphatase)
VRPERLLTIAEILERARNIKLLAMDVDGVLTRGEVIYTESGEEIKIFNVKDGHGISVIRAAGIEVALITGRNSNITLRRAEELKIGYVYQGVKRKLPVLEELAITLGLSFEEIVYVGDDTPDIPVLEVVGLAMCPSDAVEEVKRVCHYTTKAPGGRGAIREVTDLLMQAKLPVAEQTTLSEQITQT